MFSFDCYHLLEDPGMDIIETLVFLEILARKTEVIKGLDHSNRRIERGRKTYCTLFDDESIKHGPEVWIYLNGQKWYECLWKDGNKVGMERT